MLRGQPTDHRGRLFTTHIDLAPRENKPGNWGTYWESWKSAAASGPAAAAKVNRYQQRPAMELYDLNKDPHELQNLAEDPAQADRVREMRAE